MSNNHILRQAAPLCRSVPVRGARFLYRWSTRATQLESSRRRSIEFTEDTLIERIPACL